MYLGVSSALSHGSPREWAVRHKELGLKSVVFPVDHLAGDETVMAYREAADSAGLTIAEVGIWRNTLAADSSERAKWTEYAKGQLRMADRIGARCCVNVVGTPYGPRWDGGYRDNFSPALWDMAVSMVRDIIDAVNPVNTMFCIEPMPWMIPGSPDEYLRLVRLVDRPQFGVHLDVVNMITSPRRYFYNDLFLEECFDKLGGRICSCHLKDIRLKEEYTFQLEECACGEGTLDIRRYLRLATAEDPRMPMIIEHLGSDAEYVESVKYIKSITDNGQL